MRTWLTRGAVAAALGVAISLPAAPALAELETQALSPSGEAITDAPLPAEPDPLFDEDFDAELELSSDVDHADPFENANRVVFAFNQGVNTVFYRPVTRGYRFLVPGLARKGLRQAYLNLNSPKILVNDLLQLRFEDAAQTLYRFVLNSTLGLGGLFDIGKAAGFERHDNDFGRSLAKMGVVSGPYIMVPILGPSTVRDGLGSLVDLAFQPLAYVLGPAELMVQVYIGGGNSLTLLDANHDGLEALEDSSVDFYAALRSAYLQSRRAAIEGLAPLNGAAAGAAAGTDAEVAVDSAL
jgi:phospholipid-binding lipoprotein MlaA